MKLGLLGRALPLACAIGCTQALTLSRDDSATVLGSQLLTAPDPSARGPYLVRVMNYGSGTDRQRAAFRDSVSIRTRSVDGAAFATPQPKTKDFRESFWGFDMKHMPVNGRVWYPEGVGPFPFVLIVHGNHDMEDFSDPGYAYLGDLFASRGFILASVDENFLNGDLHNENDARGWMLLQHLKVWRALNDSVGRPFYHKVDMDRIALMGHSRGGEAVAVAAAFNRLRHYPDDATLSFDFGFGIRSLIAIAPVDGQYKPSDMPTPLENVNYLVVHGSHDGDVSSFSGLRQYERVGYPFDRRAPSDTSLWFKSAWYVYRANHGQWNTVWNDRDNGPRSARTLDLRGLLAPQDQRRFAEVVMTAFLEATLHGRREYLPLFRDHRTIGGWLPKTMYITRFQDSGLHTLADFQEDVDVESGSVPGVRISGDSLASWKEADIPMRWKGNDFGTKAVWLGWNVGIAGADTTQRGQPASYRIAIPDSLRRAWRIDSLTALEFSMAPTNVVPPKRKPFVDSTRKASPDSARARDLAVPSDGEKAKPDTTPMDLTVALVDANGVIARVPLSNYGAVRRPLETHVYRRADRDEQRFANPFEYVLQTYVIPVADFVRSTPGFDADRVVEVRWLFDRTPAGTVILDDVGLSRIDAAFLLAR